ncbi:M15 family metallopeptidase [Antiquaquibacter soli]|uniref:M15 family metallopeptidase n=1 Tax=Antiquaquibacter soli TaxID=3064523 RepID=A0ABT9BPN3_9MICO|nr:M15 family metallopeptidase [Protaetiibacter sp. WY-16]MDO7882981.1 M15 family metallopeptidase [Protaetiibacter sp. WY-16]
MRQPLLRPLARLALAVAFIGVLAGCATPAADRSMESSEPGSSIPAPPDLGSAGLTEADGYVAPGVWLTLDDDVPAITNLEDDLRAALDAAALSARERGVEFSFTNGWRSAAYQQYLFDRAVEEYGSEEEASRWVKRADESRHVTGGAVDVATSDAMDWLNRFGAEFGLCQIYANELWHFEHVPGVDAESGCPAQLTDSSAG